ncbi:MAG TPA: type II toxin-antitoxin system RelE/ParE family toxin [Tepidisphaeraceae bacterium]|nr:type II toxin-antitoxin system RelE/ParE family toxin [Tepidisphaeraceae bacterium]
MRWTISILPPAAKQLANLDRSVGKRISAAITALSENPRPPGSKKLVGADAHRIRVGDWRVIYQIRDEWLIVLVVRIGHRREIYD